MTLQFKIDPKIQGKLGTPNSTVQAAFGTKFIEYMASAQWTRENGWHDARIMRCEPLVLPPSAQALHYGQTVFEGMKAYRQGDDIALFRPFENARRMMRSCERMAMPVLPENTFVTAVNTLVATDRSWISDEDAQTLYIRPFMFADQPGLGFFRRPDSFRFLAIACPVGSYFQAGEHGLKVAVEFDHSRTSLLGTGMAKCGGNYAGTLLAIEKAAQSGCDQVMWLDSCTQTQIEELSTSNVFFVLDRKLVTPSLSGSILAGITRDSILKLAKDLGIPAVERSVSLDECLSACVSGRMTEAFSCGTTSMITAIGSIFAKGKNYSIGDEREGEVTNRLRLSLEDIQFGRSKDSYGWRYPIT